MRTKLIPRIPHNHEKQSMTQAHRQGHQKSQYPKRFKLSCFLTRIYKKKFEKWQTTAQIKHLDPKDQHQQLLKTSKSSLPWKKSKRKQTKGKDGEMERLRELAIEISLDSLGSSHTFPLPHLRTLAASRFCSFSDTIAPLRQGLSMRGRRAARVSWKTTDLISVARVSDKRPPLGKMGKLKIFSAKLINLLEN